MPKTIINEIDNTTGVSSSALTNTVYIPGLVKQSVFVLESGAESGAEPDEYVFNKLATGFKESDLKPHLLTSADELDELVESVKGVYTLKGSQAAVPPSVTVYLEPEQAKSFALAKYLLNNGCYVLFQIVTSDVKADWTKRFKALQDKGLYDIKFICLGDFVNDGKPVESGEKQVGNYDISDVINCAEKRGDCIALIDHPIQIPSNIFESGDDVDDYALGVHRWVAKNTSSSYAAAFSPWCSNTLYNTGTTREPVYPLLPPSFSFLATYANSVKRNPNWLSAAGAFRGIVPGLVKVGHKYGEVDIDTLQCRKTSFTGSEESFANGDNVGVACNPICNIEPFGVIIWGNRTALLNGADGLKATSFLNVRNLACDIKKTMWNAARKYTFEQNTLRLWLNFCSQVRPLLDSAKVGEGISTYKFVQEPTTVKARLKAKVIIVPIEAVEDFELSFVLEDTIETEESVG